MKPDDFEKRLQQVTPREIPSAWREEILANARESAISVQPPNSTRLGLFHFIQILRFHPQRVACAGLAVTWAVIATLHLATGETSQPMSLTAPAAPVTPEIIQALKEQRLLYTELVGRPELSPLNRIKINIPSPRSQRREEIAIA
jgi:hypothetical protein